MAELPSFSFFFLLWTCLYPSGAPGKADSASSCPREPPSVELLSGRLAPISGCVGMDQHSFTPVAGTSRVAGIYYFYIFAEYIKSAQSFSNQVSSCIILCGMLADMIDRLPVYTESELDIY